MVGKFCHVYLSSASSYRHKQGTQPGERLNSRFVVKQTHDACERGLIFYFFFFKPSLMSNLTNLRKVNVKGDDNKRHQEGSARRHRSPSMQAHIYAQPRKQSGGTSTLVGSLGCDVVGLDCCWNYLLGWALALQVR